MKPVRVRTAVIAGAVATVVLGIIFQLVVNTGSTLPRHSWWEVGLLLLAAVALLSSGMGIRRYVASLSERDAEGADGETSTAAAAARRIEPPSPESARRTLVLSQATAVGGSVLAGWYLAQIGAQLQRWNVPSVRTAAMLLGVLTLVSVGLSVAGFTVQKWCTLPEDRR